MTTGLAVRTAKLAEDFADNYMGVVWCVAEKWEGSLSKGAAYISVEDLVQEGVQAVLQRLHLYKKKRAEFSTFIWTVCVNRFTDIYRANVIRGHEFSNTNQRAAIAYGVEDESNTLSDDQIPVFLPPDARAIEQEVYDQTVADMNEDQRAVLDIWVNPPSELRGLARKAQIKTEKKRGRKPSVPKVRSKDICSFLTEKGGRIWATKVMKEVRSKVRKSYRLTSDPNSRISFR